MRPLLTVALGLLLAPVQDAEKRFPPLRVPDGFQATLFAGDPLIEYPSVLAIGPRPGTIFLAHDYMTGLGIEIVRRDEIRLVEDTDGDGRADKTTVYAGGFNSIQGLAFHDGRVYAMHAPFLTSLKDTDGDGVADQRKDLLEGIGWTPEKAPDRLHGANGVTAGHDGWLYLALGDRGADVRRPEGDRFVLHGGGILRCRPDGTDLHAYATGLRNIYDVALDDELNAFVRDNENDGGTYKIRVCHSFFGADHGYPYLYEERPAEALAPLADLGLGSSAGGVCYLARAFPPEYRGNLFFCEWGRSVVRYAREPRGASFAPVKEIEFASGDPADPYGFKPTDVVVDRDGSLLVSDWGDGQRPRRGRGRVYRIRHPAAAKDEAPPDRLKDLWTLPIDALWNAAETDADPRVRAQAVRALADRTDPVLVRHRLDAEDGDPEAAKRLAAIGRGADPRVLLQVILALGRLRWKEAPGWIRENLGTPDAALAHAAMQTLRKSRNGAAVAKLLDEPGTLRTIALRAVADQHDPAIVAALLPRPDRESLDILTRVCRKPGPWVYWGFRPGPRPANPEPWEMTGAIEAALDQALGSADRATRTFLLCRMQREMIVPRPETLTEALRKERDPEAAAVLIESLRPSPSAVEEVVRERGHTIPNRLAALEIFSAGEGRLLELARSLEDSAVLAAALRLLGKRPEANGETLLMEKLPSTSVDVRVAAIDALAELGAREAGGPILNLLGDADASVRRAAATGVGRLGVKEAAEPLLRLVEEKDPEMRRRCLESLGRLREPRALAPALAGLRDSPTELAALECLGEVGGPDQAGIVAELASKSRSADVLGAAVRALARWKKPEQVAAVQGATGVLLLWTIGDQVLQAAGPDGRIDLGKGEWVASTDVEAAEAVKVQLLASSGGTLEVSVNGTSVHRRPSAGAFAPDSDRIEAGLRKGTNRIVLRFSAGPFQARFRRKTGTADQERLAQAVLAGKGDAERGRKVFFDPAKPGCVKCHRIGDQGGRVGPDMTGAGRRFPKIHLIESILEPSRSIAPSYQNMAVKLRDGRILAGVKTAETDLTITLGDVEGKDQVVRKSEIDDQRVLALSLMPEGLEKGMTEREFVDLVAFLLSLK